MTSILLTARIRSCAVADALLVCAMALIDNPLKTDPRPRITPCSVPAGEGHHFDRLTTTYDDLRRLIARFGAFRPAGIFADEICSRTFQHRTHFVLHGHDPI